MAGSHTGRTESRFAVWRNLTRELRRMTPKRRLKTFGGEKRNTQANPDTRGTRVFPARRARTS